MKISKYHIKKASLHLGAMVSIVILTIIIFFFVYLPYTTKPKALVVVPDVQGKSFEEAVSLLSNNDLKYEIADSDYYADWPPKAVLLQYPSKQDTVKKNRKIYLTLNKSRVPHIIIPNIIDGSLKNARLRLNSHHLTIGNITYVRDLAINAVLAIQIKGKKITKKMISEGYEVPINAQIDLVVGDGYKKHVINIPNLIGRPIDEAENILTNIGLRVGQIRYRKANASVGEVIDQMPAADSVHTLSVGAKIDLWVTEDNTN